MAYQKLILFTVIRVDVRFPQQSVTGILMVYRVIVIDSTQEMNRCVLEFAVDSDSDGHLCCVQHHGRGRCNRPF